MKWLCFLLFYSFCNYSLINSYPILEQNYYRWKSTLSNRYHSSDEKIVDDDYFSTYIIAKSNNGAFRNRRNPLRILERISSRRIKTKTSKTTTAIKSALFPRGGDNPIIKEALPIVPLNRWISPAILCALFYALYNIFIKKASNTPLDPILGGVLLQFVAAIVGTVLLIVKRKFYGGNGGDIAAAAAANSGGKSSITTGIYWSIGAGLAVGGAEILSFIISGMGVQAMQSIPVIIGGSVLIGTLLGTVCLKETLSFRGWLGVLLISLGIALVGMDAAPGTGH